MKTMRVSFVLLTAAALSLGACAADGYTGVNVGFGYDYPFYDPAACWNSGWYDYGWSGPYCGWYDGLFYPGTGIYVYDREHHAHLWSDADKTYWNQRRDQWHEQATTAARQTLGVTNSATASRPIAQREMGAGMPGFRGRFGGFRGVPRAGGRHH
jgi:hypothetical protein